MTHHRRRSLFLSAEKVKLPLSAAALLLAAEGCNPTQEGSPGPSSEAVQALLGSPRMVQAVEKSTAHLLSLRGSLGLDSQHGFVARSAVQDDLGLLHMRLDQTYRGVRVWEGEAIVELSRENSARSVIHTLRAGIDVPTQATLSRAEALSIAQSDLQPQGSYASDPTVELVIYPQMVPQVRAQRLRGPEGELNAEDVEHVVGRYQLAYYVRTALENGAVETKHTDYLIDAHSGDILKRWNALQTTAVTGSASSQYSGTVDLGTDSVMAGFELRDTARSMNITTYNLNHGTSGTGSVFADADNKWGDGKNYVAGGPTTNDNGQTAGVDAHFGTERTFDYYMNVHGRNGIDGAGKATYNRVHYSSKYDNAFWSDSCFCMTYGDGSQFTVLTSLDVAGHEMTHGVTSRTANLTYSGESGGLNEAMSDIHGTMVEFYARGGSGSTIGNTGGNWLIGEQLNATPLRYMIKPSKDGASKDAWSSTLGSIDVHFSSGPLNRAFYFLSQGSSSVSTNEAYSSYLPGGMTGIGNDKAARIAFRALATKMTSGTNYAAARTAFLAAASDLFGGTTGPEYAAVQNAFAAINVGSPAGGTDTTPPTTNLTAPTAGSTLSGAVTVSANANDNIGVTKVEFYAGATLIGSDTTSPYSISWNSATVTNGMYALTSKAYDAAGNSTASAAVSVTVSNMGTDMTPPTTNLTAPTAGSTLSGSVTVSANAMDNVGVTKVEFYAGATLFGTATTAPYSVSWNSATVTNGTYALTSKAYDAAGNSATSTAVSVTVNNTVADTTPPATNLTAPTSGTVSGSVTVAANATDNIGVAKVEFYAGATLIGTDTTAPYSVAWNTTAVANGRYSLTSKAYDAAGNTGTSAAVAVTVNNGGGSCSTSSQLLANPGFESGNSSWTATSGVIDNRDPANAHSGSWVAWMTGYGSPHTDTMYQQVTIPAAACSATLSFWLGIETLEIDPVDYDTLTVTVQDTTGKVLGTLASYSNVDATGAYAKRTFDLSAYKGKTVRLHFSATEDLNTSTSFFIDDVALDVKQ